MAGIFKLTSGGLLVNYRCQANCAHCMYMCSPQREEGYIAPELAAQVFQTAKRLGCPSMHLSGGEPFLEPARLFEIIEVANREQMPIAYVETSASWCTDDDITRHCLFRIKELGVECVSISISPYQAEFIPADYMFRCTSIGRELDLSVYVYQDEFVPDVAALPTEQTHTLSEFTQHFGQRYFHELPSRFGLSMTGRALITHKDTLPTVPIGRINHMQRSCAELTNRSHFHVDMHGRYIPPGCVGISIPLDALGQELDPEEFPIFTRLCLSPKHLLDYCKALGYCAEGNYYNRCHLCQCLRAFLFERFPGKYKELQPDEFYTFYASEKQAAAGPN